MTAAMTGKNGSFSAKKARLSRSALDVWMRGSAAPTPTKTRIDTSATMTRNVVPQRGCIVVFERAAATVSGSPAS